jgi:hypothetical protein
MEVTSHLSTKSTDNAGADSPGALPEGRKRLEEGASGFDSSLSDGPAGLSNSWKIGEASKSSRKTSLSDLVFLSTAVRVRGKDASAGSALSARR